MSLKEISWACRLRPLAHRHCPDAPRDAADDGVFRIHAVAEEERQVGREVVDVHAAREISLDEGESVGQRERQLRDRVRAGLGDVVARDRHRIEIPDVVLDEILLDVSHHLEAELGGEDAGVLPLVFLENVRLDRAAHRRQGLRLDAVRFVPGRVSPVVGLELVELLVDGRVQEHRQQRRRRTVDGHRHRVVRRRQVEAGVEHLHVVERGDGHARVADLAVDVGAQRRIVAVERDRIERGGEPLRRHAVGEHVEALVGAKGVALACEHARRVFILALEREYAGCVGKRSGHVLGELPAQDLAVILVARQRDFRDMRAGERDRGQRAANFLAADFDDVFVAGVGGFCLRPCFEEILRARVEAASRAAISESSC